MKNTVYAIAKECTDPLSLEDFGFRLGRHFLTTYPEIVTGAKVMLFEKPWERATVDGQPHNHGFKLGSEKHTVEVVVNSARDAKVTSGVSELSLLKTTQSGFEGFLRDKYTLLPETRERMLASAIRAVWSYSSKPADYQKTYGEVKDILVSTFFGPPHEGIYSHSVQKTLYEMAQAVLSRFPEIESVYLNMPNIHFLPVNMPTVGVKFGDDVFNPTDEPHGSIEARLSRKPFLISNL
jgi:urate oxidase